MARASGAMLRDRAPGGVPVETSHSEAGLLGPGVRGTAQLEEPKSMCSRKEVTHQVKRRVNLEARRHSA